jgi:hypothetical protein
MRAGRILVVTLGLSMLATSAYAECSWVLWSGDSSEPWITATALEAYGSREECGGARQRYYQRDAEAREAYEAAIKAGASSTQERQRQSQRQIYRCLPDIVDPRGPKAK